MNKDVKGLIIYLLIMLLNILIPTVFLWVWLIAFLLSDHNHYTLTRIAIGLLITLFILYFLIPLITTHYAIKKHWSIYLDRFFNQWLLPSLVLVILLLPMAAGIKIPDDVSEELFIFLSISYISVAPCYCLIYLVIFWHNFFRLVKNLINKIRTGYNKK